MPRFVFIIVACGILAGCGGSTSGKNGTGKIGTAASTRKQKREAPAVETPRVEMPVEPQPVEPADPPALPTYRPPDRRRRHDDRKLAEAGIHKYVSKRLLLYTDIAPEAARPLPPLLDRIYDAWEEYFGPMPPDREGTGFQMTGYIMANPKLYQQAGLLPENLPHFQHGRHRGAEFWINDQKDDYYRRHLMLHEGTHCFMTYMPGAKPGEIVWYFEGMAELFATHTTENDVLSRFRILPGDRDRFAGLGRIRMIQDDRGDDRLPSLTEILDLGPNDFARHDESYAWSWALCKFLDAHPRYRDRFRSLYDHMRSSRFRAKFDDLFRDDEHDLKQEWLLFADTLVHGYDVERAAVDFRPGKPLRKSAETTCTIIAGRGWQSGGVAVEKGVAYVITAEGRFTLADKPKPWVSDAGGVTIRFAGGRPLGILLATVRTDDPREMLKANAVGRGAELTAVTGGTVYFRINDFWNELADNTGQITVRIRRVEEQPAR